MTVIEMKSTVAVELEAPVFLAAKRSPKLVAFTSAGVQVVPQKSEVLP